MSRNNTGNPIGSKAFPDFEDNVKNLDEAVNTADPQWVDRFGRFRLPLMEQERQFVASQDSREDQFQSSQDYREDQFQLSQDSREDLFQSAQSSREAVFSDFLQASGYQELGEYAPGIEITAHNQYVTFGGQPYTLKPSIPVPYTTSGVWTGDDFKLIGDDVLRQDLANPDIGAAMVARGVVAVDSIADLLAMPEGQKKEGLRYLVGERVAGSGVGGGEFRWDGSSTEASNGGTVFSPAESMPGRFVRLFEGPLRTYWFLEGDKTDLGYVQNALTFAYTSGRDIELEHSETFNASTPFTIGPASGSYSGTVSGYLNINANAGFPPEATLLTIRNCNGEISANIFANGFDRCRVAIEYQGTGRLILSGDVHGRRATRWGQLMTSFSGNSNSMRWLGELRSTLCGSNYTQDFQHLSTASGTTTIATPVVSEIGINSIVHINGRWYQIESSSPEETVIRPTLPTGDRTDGSMQIFVGGGYLTHGSDAGVGTIAKMVMQANLGVGMRSGSLYGNAVTAFVGELNSGPSIVVGSSTTAANLKNVFVDAYFEGGPNHRVVMLSSSAALVILHHFNLGRNGVYKAGSSALQSEAGLQIGLVDKLRLPERSRITASTTERVLEEGGIYYIRSVPSITAPLTIILSPYSWLASGVDLTLEDFDNRPVVFQDGDGALVNDLESVTLPNPGTLGVKLFKVLGGWMLTTYAIDIPEG